MKRSILLVLFGGVLLSAAYLGWGVYASYQTFDGSCLEWDSSTDERYACSHYDYYVEGGDGGWPLTQFQLDLFVASSWTIFVVLVATGGEVLGVVRRKFARRNRS